MYIPSIGMAKSALLRFLQLPLWLSGSDQTILRPAVSNGQSVHHSCKALNGLGNKSPYHDAPTVPGLSADLPDDCSVNQIILLHRHGSRGPVGEQVDILKLVDTLNAARNIIQAATLPPELEFLKEGYEYQLVPEELTIIGRKELFDHGVEFALRYPTFSTDVIVSTTVQRVIDSARFFAQGWLGLGAEDITFLTTDDFDGPVSWLTPWDSCPKLTYDEGYRVARQWTEKYIPPIVDRFNKLIPGVRFSPEDVRGALYACPYDIAARNQSSWCDVFTERELRNLEYGMDLLLDVITGHVPRGDPGPLVGAFYVKELINRLTDEARGAASLYLEFAHDMNILYALSAMGLNKDALPLSPVHPPLHRKFKSSDQTPFAASMVWERFTCSTSGPQVRLVLNGATFPLSICEETDEDAKYGTCSLDAFVRANNYSMNAEYHSEFWNATCGVQQ